MGISASIQQKTLKELSYDNSHGESLINSEIMAIDFDSFKDKYTRQLQISVGDKISNVNSADALIVAEKNDKRIFIIEFKNGKVDPTEANKIKTKLSDSAIMLMDDQEISVKYLRQYVYFILVYNDQHDGKGNIPLDATGKYETTPVHGSSDPKQIIRKTLERKSNTRAIRFGLHKYKDFYYRDVYTVNATEFNSLVIEWNLVHPDLSHSEL